MASGLTRTHTYTHIYIHMKVILAARKPVARVHLLTLKH